MGEEKSVQPSIDKDGSTAELSDIRADAPPDAPPTSRGALKWLWCSLAVVIADQLTKIAALLWIDPLAPKALAPMLNLVLAYNPGAAFSILSTAGGWQRGLFIGLALAVSALVVRWLYTMPRNQRLMSCALSLLLGGAIGNMIDRIHLGAVIDFIDVHVAGRHWPAFNVADSAICIGVVLLMICTLRPNSDSED
ncbi:signal peptidase II [Thioalkalivibrio sp. HK1]|uniref:signal peptidase II n=1 Tax=Thioalkalivibrio sp. HK1 TaxID=1469245 RepID=UPI0009DD6F3B|nr:signal peptidase II [Thioalkalivibrio sp. HK1]